METRVLVRVQARGGKFIGPDGGYALVTLREVVTGEILAQRIATGGSAAPVALPAGAGSYELVVNAVQAAEGNVGNASYFFAATGSGDAC